LLEIETYFRYCPQCGKRFHIRLVSKKEVSSHEETIEETHYWARGTFSPTGTHSAGPAVLEESIPHTIEIEDFQYSYKCKHCGHEWTESHVEEKKRS
jgi:predicted RNA-binding Zn-ribbon protein involved in translation (DUF1610 family)